MGKISTKQLISRYFKSIEGTPAEKQRAIIDKTELYDYEEKSAKNLLIWMLMICLD